jgi:hypothetical protein
MLAGERAVVEQKGDEIGSRGEKREDGLDE